MRVIDVRYLCLLRNAEPGLRLGPCGTRPQTLDSLSSVKTSLTCHAFPRNAMTTSSYEPNTEAALVDQFVKALEGGRTCWGPVQITTEWDHKAGFADVLVRTENRGLIAFEAKLSDWKRAFFQAYRNAAYANRVYVLMPRSTVHRALLQREEFEFRGIGLCSINEGKIQIHIGASQQKELLSWVRRRANAHFDGAVYEPRIVRNSSQELLPA